MYGRTPPEGFLPVFSVDTEAQAKKLLIGACSRDEEGNYYSPLLARGQTLENLQTFSDRLLMIYEHIFGDYA